MTSLAGFEKGIVRHETNLGIGEPSAFVYECFEQLLLPRHLHFPSSGSVEKACITHGELTWGNMSSW